MATWPQPTGAERGVCGRPAAIPVSQARHTQSRYMICAVGKLTGPLPRGNCGRGGMASSPFVAWLGAP